MGVTGSWGPVAVAGLGDSSQSCTVGVRGEWGPERMRTRRLCAHGLRLGVGRGLAAAAVAGHALYVGCHRGLVGGRGRCRRTLATFWPGRGRSVGLGCGL